MKAPESVERCKPSTALVVGAIGVVFGDIGTSPLYTLRECFKGTHGLAPTPENVIGILSVIFWTLMIVVAFKYATLIMRADNRGEGGILALTALVSRGLEQHPRKRWFLVGLGILGAAMFYGDGMITPAISVLSAVEGLEVMAPQLHSYVMPVTLVVLIALFSIQKRGTHLVGGLFGPVCCLWFLVLALLGIWQISKNPGVLWAVNPAHAIHLVMASPRLTFVLLGAVVLAVTGVEALYADMGHFGPPAIRRAWKFIVLPSLVLNYFGQGSLLIARPDAVQNPFYLMAPEWALFPLIVLATCAAVIASQAVISGAFSLTRAAVQMGYLPRLKIAHTSAREIGQIYVPFINWTLLLAVILLVVGFGSSTALAGAYGIAVTLLMLIDSVLIYFVMRRVWHWSRPLAVIIALPLVLIDLAFLSSNALKIPDGGWFPLIVGAFVFMLLTTWKQGRAILMARLSEDTMPLDVFIQSISLSPPPRVPGTAIFLTSMSDRAPHALLHNLKHNKVLHERVVFLTVVTRDIPRVEPENRLTITEAGFQFWLVEAAFGFTEDPDIPQALELCGRTGLQFDMMDTSFFVSRETLIVTANPGMALWREQVFVSMSKNAVKATDFFHVPTNRVVELGSQVEI